MRAQDFIQEYSRKGHTAWEAAALSLFRQGELTLWPWVDLPLSDRTDTLILRVQSDVLAVGTPEDYIRLPMTPNAAQGIANLIPGGALLTTPLIEYRIWQQAQHKLPPTDMAPNRGINLEQFREHSALIDNQLAARGATSGQLITGHKKGVVIANFYKPGKVLICCWFRPPPAADVFDDRRAIGTPGRQPVQPKSNIHGDFYFDYSHGIRLVHPFAVLNGQEIPTAQVYQHPVYSNLVSDDGPLRVLRYPTNVPVTPSPTAFAYRSVQREDPPPLDFAHVFTMPSISDYALDKIRQQRIALARRLRTAS